MKFSGKMCLMIILKVKKTEVDLLSRKYNFGKTTRVFLGLKNRDYKQNIWKNSNNNDSLLLPFSGLWDVNVEHMV